MRYFSKVKRPVKNIVTGKVYESLTEACSNEGLNYAVTYSRLTGKKKNNTNLRFTFVK